MKHIFLIAFLLCSDLSFGQKITKPVTVKAGSSAFVTINGQDYPRQGYLGFEYTYNAHDSQVSIYFTYTKESLLRSTVDTNFYFADTSNKQVRNMGSLRTWLQTNAY